METQVSANYELLDRLADEFAERFRRGQRPSLQEYIDRYPELAAEIRDVLPALVEIAQADEGRKQAAALLRATTPEQVGDYRLIREIGRGGMGVVYEAEQISLGRRVALKVLPHAALKNEKAVERFKREARAAAQLHHTNIVPVFEVGEHGDLCYYAMQFIQGQALDEVVRELHRSRQGVAAGGTPGAPAQAPGAPLTIAERLLNDRFELHPAPADEAAPPATTVTLPRLPDTGAPLPRAVPSSSTTNSDLGALTRLRYYGRVAALGVQLADALAYAHRQGIVHRDIKPANLLVDMRSTLWITDFGLARAAGSAELTGPGEVVGTLRYMAPERLKGAGDARSDIYSAGATLYELLTLQPIFTEPDRGVLMSQILLDEPPRPRRLDARIPRDLETIVLKAIARDPARRYASADDLAADLRRFLEGEPIKARQANVAERARLWCRRHKALAALYGVVCLAALGSSVMAVYLNSLLGHSEELRLRTARAEQQHAQDLWDSYAAQARATRMTRQPGQRFGALAAIKKALELDVPDGRSRDALRNEAIAALCLPDLEVEREWDGYPTGSTAFAIDPAFERYARADNRGNVSIRSIAGDAQLYELPGAAPCADYAGLTFSPNGRFLRVRDGRQRETLWRLEGATPVRLRSAPRIGVFSPDSRRLAVCDERGDIRVVDTVDGRELQHFSTAVRDGYADWNPVDPRRILIINQDRYQIVNLETGSVGPLVVVAQGAGAGVWHPEGRKAALAAFMGGDHNIRIWDTHLRKAVLPPLTGHRTSGILLRFNHAGDLLASNDWTGLMRLWDTRTGNPLLLLPLDGHTLQFSPADDRLAAHTGGGKVRILRVASGKEFRTLVRPGEQKHPGYYDHAHIAVHHGGRLLAMQLQSGFVLIDAQRLEELIAIPGTGPVLDFEASGEALLTAGPPGLLRWPVQVSGDGTQVELGAPRRLGDISQAPAAMSADGTVIAASNGHGAVVWRLQENRRLETRGKQTDVRFCALSRDGRWVATGCGELLDGAGVKVWSATKGELVSQLPVGRMAPVWFSPDDKWLVTGGASFRTWEVGSWREGPVLASSGQCNACSFTADGRIVALCDTLGVVRLVEIASGRELARLTAPVQTRLWPKCFTPDGAKLIVLGNDTETLHEFNLALIGAELHELRFNWDLGVSRSAIAPATIAPPAPLGVHVNVGAFRNKQWAQQLTAEAIGVLEANDLTRAAVLFRQAAAADPQNALAHNNLAWLLATGPAQMRDPALALAHAQKAVALAPGNRLFDNTLGVALFRNNRCAEALPALERALHESKGQFDAYDLFFLALCHHRLGHADKARECRTRALAWLNEHRSKLSASQLAELAAFEREVETELKSQ